MGRKRSDDIRLPKGVERTTAKGHIYYYWNPGRKTDREGERLRLPNPKSDPVGFWREIERRQRTKTAFATGSVGELVDLYRSDEAFQRLADSTKASYNVHLDRFCRPDGWGFLRAKDLTPAGVLAARNAMKDTPPMANQMLAVGRTVWDWAIPLDYVESNPFDKVKDFDELDRGHIPWPLWVRVYVDEHAPEDIRRLMRLGIMTCQRESDLIRMGPAHRDRSGIWCRPRKTRRRRRSFFIPLNTADALELDRWAETPISSSSTRWKKPIARHNPELYLYSPRAAAYSGNSIRARWGRWLNRTPAGKALCDRWRVWLSERVKRYEWEIDPDDARGPTIHGLRGTGILARHADGYDVDQIANDIGMSNQMVERYMRFKDQMEIAERGRARLRLVDRKR